MSTSWAIIYSLILLAGNGFFVAAEFALVASKRYRLEHAAAEGSRAARAALDGSRDLALMLAGAQLGITLCTLGLGALAEPAIEHLTHPLLHAAGLPDVASGVIAFLLALVVVTFLHLVIGEMMPKSWAITDPERSATILALPFRMFVRAIRPALVGLNGLANAALKPFGVHAQDQLAQAHGPEEMNILLERSRAEGLLEAEQTELLTSMLKLQETKVRDLLIPDDQLVTVSPGSSAAEVEAASQRSGRSRLAVVAPAGSASGTAFPGSSFPTPGAGGAGSGEVVGVVHVREAVRATTAGVPATAAQLMDPPFDLEASVTVTDAVTRMRAARAQLAMVTRDGERVGFVALEDLLEQVIGEFDDETDPVPVGRRMR
ncbi:hemolysin family protein [Couchioplanes caeruleus]|uniref:hemolysin family protein n=1 Tax=Couchioplanes caeruleus TaxID=56438 RepID=UPI0020BDDA30|nr:hemolysin family protein [Couchioplanes caeruleus]UQU66331.1 hemolysin family protein [Couchioplanes caeruleus]